MLTQWCKSFINSGLRSFSFNTVKRYEKPIDESIKSLKDESNYTADKGMTILESLRSVCRRSSRFLKEDQFCFEILPKLTSLVQDFDEKTFVFLTRTLFEIRCQDKEIWELIHSRFTLSLTNEYPIYFYLHIIHGFGMTGIKRDYTWDFLERKFLELNLPVDQTSSQVGATVLKAFDAVDRGNKEIYWKLRDIIIKDLEKTSPLNFDRLAFIHLKMGSIDDEFKDRLTNCILENYGRISKFFLPAELIDFAITFNCKPELLTTVETFVLKNLSTFGFEILVKIIKAYAKHKLLDYQISKSGMEIITGIEKLHAKTREKVLPSLKQQNFGELAFFHGLAKLNVVTEIDLWKRFYNSIKDKIETSRGEKMLGEIVEELRLKGINLE